MSAILYAKKEAARGHVLAVLVTIGCPSIAAVTNRTSQVGVY